MALKRGERRDLAQGTLGFQEKPKEMLRAVQVTPNDAAREANFVIFPNMRIPELSIINRVFAGDAADGQAAEDLSWWESSDGSRLPSAKVLVQVRSSWDGVRALITPS
jgi:hypothetical protein